MLQRLSAGLIGFGSIAAGGMAGLLAACSATPSHPDALPGDAPTGVVFHDADGDGTRGSDEVGLGGVRVSNGRDVVVTDENGRYTLQVEPGDGLFVIKPTDWQVPIDPKTKLPQHYYLHEPDGTPEAHYAGVSPTGPLPDSVDFALRPQDEPRAFDVILFGDTQPRDQREVDFISHDVTEELIGVEAAFGATLGDLVFDDLDVLPEIAGSVGTIGIPWHHVIGNHDVNRDAPDLATTDATYRRLFGPSTYSFDYGDVHFIVLNDIFWEVGGASYHAELTEDIKGFIESDLAFVPAEQLVVLMMHIPLVELVDPEGLFALLSGHPHTLSFSSHWHVQEQHFMDTGIEGAPPHTHVITGTACGSWWRGHMDELGIPHSLMRDGTPNGYTIVSFEGTDYGMRYKAARRPADYQMNVFAPEVVAPTDSAQVVANFFAGSEKCRLELRLGDGEWMEMERFDGEDPAFLALKEREAAFVDRILAERAKALPVPAEASTGEDEGATPAEEELGAAVWADYRELIGRELPNRHETNHLWRATLPPIPPPGYHVIRVRATDRFGAVHEARRVIRVSP